MKKYKDKKQYRYKGYDYSQNGCYFVTICTKNREIFFGDIVGTQNLAFLRDFAFLRATEIGKIAEKFWREIPDHFPFVKLDKFVIMPNHVHGIIQIDNPDPAGTQDFAFPLFQPEYQNKFGPQSKNLSSIIRGFKIGVTKYANNKKIDFAWQSRFHDHIIRNDYELDRIRQYIIYNPIKWESDQNNSKDLYM